MVAQSLGIFPVMMSLTVILGGVHFMSVPAKGSSFATHPRPQFGLMASLSGNDWPVNGQPVDGSSKTVASSAQSVNHLPTKSQPVKNQTVDEPNNGDLLYETPPYQTVLDMTGTLERGDRIAYQDGSLYDEYELDGQAGQRVWIRLESPEFDPYLILIDPQGNILAENDDVSPDDYTAFLDLILPIDGIYRVVANGVDRDSRGQYWLTVVMPLSEADDEILNEDSI